MRNITQWQRQRDRDGRRGFTFMEIMLVVVIIGLLAAIVVPNIFKESSRAKETTTRQQMKSIELALQIYYTRLDKFPTTDQGLEALVKCPNDVDKKKWGEDPLLPKIPRDAWGQKFIYKSPGEHNADYDIVSLGADGQEGTEDDIVSWAKDEEEL